MYQEFTTAFIQAWGSPLELLVIAFAILMLFGAKSLPGALRTLGRWQQKFSHAWREIQRELVELEQPIHSARKAWEEEMQEYTVSSSERPKILPPPEQNAEPANASDPSAPTDPTDQTAPQNPQHIQEKPHAQ